MTKEEKKKLLIELENNGLYCATMQTISTAAERRQIKAFVDDIYINLLDSLTCILNPTQKTKSEDADDIISKE